MAIIMTMEIVHVAAIIMDMEIVRVAAIIMINALAATRGTMFVMIFSS